MLRRLPSGSIDLVYADPPFFTGRWFSIGEELAFDDRWAGGLQQYLDWIYPRLRQFRRVLKGAGAIYVHTDPHASHYLKMLLDKVFGYQNFVNEIVWQRQNAHCDGKQGARHFGRVHDTILLYSKGEEYIWNPTYLPYTKKGLTSYRYVEAGTGRRYAQGDLSAPGGYANGNPFFEFLGVKRYWRYSRERLEQLLQDGRIIQSAERRVPRIKRYLDEMQGFPLQDIWVDSGVRREKGVPRYPTQKPTALLSRIIRASTKPESTVLDPFCGSGSTLISASTLGRHWIGVDISEAAIKVSQRRLSSMIGVRPKVISATSLLSV